MTFQAYLVTIKSKTGKTPDDFRRLAAEKGLTQYKEIMTWLKTDFALGQGHANVIAQLLVNSAVFKAAPDEKIASLFAGKKEKWRPVYDALLAKLSAFGADVSVAPTSSYISLLRGGKKFGILQPSSAERLDIGLNLKGLAAAGRLEASGTWNNMVTHRVRISAPDQLDDELLYWLKLAYDNQQ